MSRPLAPPATLPLRYVLIGLGGVGGFVLRTLVPFLYHAAPGARLLAVDGDRFEERNRSRMLFRRPGPKAEVLVEELAGLYADRVTLVPVNHFVTARNARQLISEGDVVFCAPDNHATRRVVDVRCGRLRNVALFSGGNDGIEGERTGTHGNVQVRVRRDGRDLTHPLSHLHPEIARPRDRLPDEEGCQAAAASAPQLVFTNAAVASAMLAAFYAWLEGALDYEESALELLSARWRPLGRRLPGDA